MFSMASWDSLPTEDTQNTQTLRPASRNFLLSSLVLHLTRFRAFLAALVTLFRACSDFGTWGRGQSQTFFARILITKDWSVLVHCVYKIILQNLYFLLALSTTRDQGGDRWLAKCAFTARRACIINLLMELTFPHGLGLSLTCAWYSLYYLKKCCQLDVHKPVKQILWNLGCYWKCIGIWTLYLVVDLFQRTCLCAHCRRWLDGWTGNVVKTGHSYTL